MRSLLMAAVICVLFAFTVGAAIDGPLFEASVHYKVGLEPYKVCIADFNNDGTSDMACAQYTGDSISVLIGKSDGGYEPAAFYTIGTYQYDITAGDIDGDGWADLVVATNNAVYSLDNAGDGTFGAAVQISGPTNSPYTVELAILDDGGEYDLIVAHNDWSYDKLTVWDNDGSGNFSLGNEYTVGTYQRVMAIADFDGDTYADIAVGTTAPNFSVLLNDGSGGFTIDDTYVLATDPRGMCAGNFDGGTDIEIAIARYQNLTVFTNDGAGGFSAGSSIGINSNGYGLAAADFDGANEDDIALSDDSVYVYYNNGSGTFTSVNTYWVGEYSEGLAVGDLDDDTYPDVAVVGRPGNSGEAAGHIAVLYNPDGDGQFMYSIQSTTLQGPVSLARALFDADSYVDVATVDWWNDSVFVLLNDGTGHFTSSFRWPVGNSPSEVVAMDVDAQFTEDLIIGHADPMIAYVTVLLSNGNGTFGPPTTYSTGAGLRPLGVYVGPLNNDVSNDIATINYTSSTITVMFNNGNGTFGVAANYPVVGPVYHSAIDGGDLDGNGFIDLVVPNSSNGCVQAFFNDGTGDFTNSGNIGIGDVYDPYQVRVDDLDNDGFADIIVGSYDSNEVCVMMNNGGSGFHATQYYYAGWEQYEIDVSDFDADGNKDIVVLNTEDYNFTILFGDGAGNFTDGGHYGIVSDDSEGLAIADFDNDGYPDVAISNYNHDNISVMLNHYSILTDVEEPGIVQNMPGEFRLSQNYPNPFNPSTTIQYNLPSRAEVTISVYNLLGQRVKVFHEGLQSAGTHQVVWNGRTTGGQAVSTGVYFYQIKAGDFVESRKMVLLK